MNAIESLLYGIASFEVLGNKANILGFIWLLALWFVAYKRFRGHFAKGYFPQPQQSYKRFLWVFAVLLISFGSVFLLQLLMDDAVTTPISIAFGSWDKLMRDKGDFTLLRLFNFKWDVYGLIFSYLFFFTAARLWQFFQFTKSSLLCLVGVIVFQVAVSGMQIFGSHMFYDGWQRIWIFWLTYPEYRILSGLLFSSILKKPRI